MISVVIIFPVAHREVANKTFVAMGEADDGVESAGAPLSPTGVAPATHVGLHTWADGPWLTKIQAMKAGTLPSGAATWASQGITPTQVRQAMAAMTISTKPDGEHVGHFDAVVASLGLQRIRGPGPGSTAG